MSVLPQVCGSDGEYGQTDLGGLLDHPVPIRLRKHTTTPVPLAICGPGIEPDGVQAFSETLAPTGKLGFLKGNELVKKLLAL